MQPWITRPLKHPDFCMSIPTLVSSSDVWLSMSVWLKMSLTRPHPPTHPAVPPTHSPTQTHTELSLFSHLSPSPQQTAVGRPSIATVRRDGPLGFEFQMTEQWSWYGHRGSCWGTVLPLLWLGPNRPAPKPLLGISSSGAQYHQTWWQSALVHPSQLIFISNHVANYKYHMFTHAAFIITYICITDSLVRFYLQFAANKKNKKNYYFICCKHSFGTLAKMFSIQWNT